jgi:mono/diheme cytochrome c family protein
VKRAIREGIRLVVVMGAAAFLSNAIVAAAQSTGGGDASQQKVVVTADARAEASQIFEERCVPCHGPEGHGDGPAAQNLKPHPRNFHSVKWQKSVSDAEIAKAIVYGGSSVGVSGEMAANPDLEDEPAIVSALVERVRSLGK